MPLRKSSPPQGDTLTTTPPSFHHFACSTMFEYLLSSSSLLPFVPVWLKAVVLVVFLLNWR